MNHITPHSGIPTNLKRLPWGQRGALLTFSQILPMSPAHRDFAEESHGPT